ncbi:MAG TPA: hypothetical protein VGF24_06790 [Vicinamibacterales bacterium]|jgi:hypothetical protein
MSRPLVYLFIVKALKPADGYYKLDVYLYYALTFLIPVTVGWKESGPRRRDDIADTRARNVGR